ncbi:MAG TPA: ATP-binding protein [Desulfomonilia bacterium]|nr:ATP-binding protein [Desulfomonilia bacterium]
MSGKVQLEKLRCVCAPDVLECRDSREAKPLQTILGQIRALKSLEFGLRIKNKGFNIYVSGYAGSGRKTAVRRYLREIAKDQPTPNDWCYVNNFKDPYRPKAISMPAGMAWQFARSADEFVKDARKEIAKAFESEEYAVRRNNTVKKFQEQREEAYNKINEDAKNKGLLIQATPMGLIAIPIIDNKPITEEEFRALDKKTRDDITRKQGRLQEQLKKSGRHMAALEKKTNEMISKLDKDVALYTLNLLLEDLEKKYRKIPELTSYLREMRDDMVENLSVFRGDEQKKQGQMEFPFVQDEELRFRKYKVNVFIDNSKLKGAPIVMELNPNYNSLFGRIEKEALFGALLTDFTMIRAGSLHQASGGYLILPVEDVLINMFSWESLKRAIRNREIRIEDAGERMGFMTTRGIMPEPIPWNIKVILIGTPYLYYRLFELDEDFQDLFKVKADFDTVMDRSRENMRHYASFVCSLCDEENLLHFDKLAIAKVIEHSCRLASDQQKLSTRFGEIANVIREASFYATEEKKDLVNENHVMQAIEERFNRSNLLMEKAKEMIGQGAIRIDVQGEKVGQVNGLSVIDLGDIMFGRPSRITASIEPGRDGLIDIEREAKLGGPIHTKGVMILSGYLAHTYARDKPISLSARLVFEQSYSGVEGDSASSTELYALLSALSGKPIRQGIAVTGSVNQKGEVQAIGGVNEKIEGFFEVCKVKGLGRGQGVIIPESNVRNLMLKDEVIEAIKKGMFTIWSVETIDEGIEILTGVKAGRKQKNGSYERNSIHHLVDRELLRLSETWVSYTEDGKKKGNNKRRKKMP